MMELFISVAGVCAHLLLCGRGNYCECMGVVVCKEAWGEDARTVHGL